MSAALIEYGVTLVTSEIGGPAATRYEPRLWLNGAPVDRGTARFCTRGVAMDEATARALVEAEQYIGKGGVTVRLRVEPLVEPPAALTADSTLADLSAHVAALGLGDVTAARMAGRDRWLVTCNRLGSEAFERTVGAGPTFGDALLEAIARRAPEACGTDSGAPS